MKYYWKVDERIGYKKSMKKIGYPDDSIKTILSCIKNNVFSEIKRQKFFFIAVNEGYDDKYEWNPTEPIFIQEGYIFKGTIGLRKEKLLKLKKLCQ